MGLTNELIIEGVFDIGCLVTIWGLLNFNSCRNVHKLVYKSIFNKYDTYDRIEDMIHLSTNVVGFGVSTYILKKWMYR
jgi:hypothetical protein